MGLTTEQIAEKQVTLANLNQVKIKFDSGKLTVRTSIDGNEVVFQKINPGKLEQHITSLRAELAPYDATVSQPVTEFVASNNRMW